MPFADLHCHPSFWSFNKQDFKNPTNPNNHIWYIRYSKKDRKRLKKSKRGTYSQSDFITLSKGDVRLVFASLYPIEKGFFMGNRDTGASADVVGGILNQIAIGWPRGLRKALSIILFPLSKIFSLVINNEGWGRDVLQKLVMGFNKSRINYIQNHAYNYYETLKDEYKFYRQFEDEQPLPPALPTTMKYKIAKSGTELENIIDGDRKIAVVFTVEGFHSICLQPNQTTEDYLELVSDETLQQRINVIQNEWRVFFITFSHHFSNHMAGHANSLPRLIQQIANPHPLKNEGFVPLIAEKTIRQLLHIDAENNPLGQNGRRVLIDVKHLSARSRKDFYERIIIPFNQKHSNDRIPVIASHCGYYGPVSALPVVDLDYLIHRADKEKDDDFSRGFYQWNINLCDEDVQVIVESQGLIGISFDQRILGQKKAKRRSIEYAINVILRNILALVVSAAANVTNNPHKVWECITIGTDFDGLIDPVDHFQTSFHFGSFKNRLLVVLEALSDERKKDLFIDGTFYDPKMVTDLICYKNALNFTKKHYN